MLRTSLAQPPCPHRELCCLGVCPDTSLSRVQSGWGHWDSPWQQGPPGPRQGAVQQWDKAAAVSLPSGHEKHACPILVCLSMASCAPQCGPNCSPVGSFRGMGRAGSGRGRSQELLSPRRKVLRDVQGGGRGPGPLVSPRITQAQPQGEGLGLQVVNRELPFIQALLQGPSKPMSLSKCRHPTLKTGRATASGLVMAARWQRDTGDVMCTRHLSTAAPKTSSGRRVGKGVPLPPPDYTAHQDILPRVGLARRPPRYLPGWLDGGTRVPVQQWPTLCGAWNGVQREDDGAHIWS